MPRKRGKDSDSHKQGRGTPPGTNESEMSRRKRTRDQRSEEEMQRVRDPDAVQRNPNKSK